MWKAKFELFFAIDVILIPLIFNIRFSGFCICDVYPKCNFRETKHILL